MKKLITGCVLAALCFCGTITETDSGISGRVRYSNGSSAGNIGVKLFRDTATTQLSYATTSGDGSYSFGKLEPGFYNVWAEDKDSVAAFRDSIYVQEEKKSTVDLTLEKGGSVTAVVRLQPGHDPRSASAQALGTEKYSNVDSAGRFTIKNLAPNEYTLRVATAIAGYAPAYLTVAVTSGASDTLKDTIVLPYFDIPHVRGIRAHYDSTTGVATVTWNKTGYATFYQYRVYRDPVDAIVPSKNPVAARVDTVFCDTLYVKKPGAPPRKNAVPDKQLRYRVTIVNKSMKEGEPYEFADVAAEDPYRVTKLLSPAEGARFTDSAGITVVWSSAGAKRRYQIQVDDIDWDTIPSFTEPVFDTVVTDTSIRLPTLFLSRFFLRVRVQSEIGDWGWGEWSPMRKVTVIGGLFAEKLNSDYAHDFVKTKDNGYAVLGSAPPQTVVIKTDSIGIEKWRWRSPGQVGMGTIIQMRNENYFVAGTEWNSTKDKSVSAMISSTGSLLWSKIIGNDSESVDCHGAIPTPDQGIITLISRSSSHGSSMPPTDGAYHLVKLNGSGTILWDTTINSIFKDQVHLLQVNEESFLLVNVKRAYKITPDSLTDSISIKKFDFSCSLKEETKFLWKISSGGYSKFLSANDGNIFMGYTCSAYAFVAKLSPLGTIIFEGNGSLFDPTADNGLVAYGGDYINTNKELIKYNANGGIVWRQKTSATILAIHEETDGSFVAIMGRATTTGGGMSYKLVKLSKTGIFFEE